MFGYFQEYLVPQNKHMDNSMSNSNLEQSPKNTFFVCISMALLQLLLTQTTSVPWDLNSWSGPARSLMTDMLEAVDHLHSYGVLLGRTFGFFNLTPLPSAVQKKTWPSLFFPSFRLGKLFLRRFCWKNSGPMGPSKNMDLKSWLS